LALRWLPGPTLYGLTVAISYQLKMAGARRERSVRRHWQACRPGLWRCSRQRPRRPRATRSVRR